MKQITHKQLEQLATSNTREFERETEYCMADWLRDNAGTVAGIEAGRFNKTLFGEWPQGWRAEMKKFAKEQSRKNLIAQFKVANVLELDGALWLNNYALIQELAK